MLLPYASINNAASWSPPDSHASSIALGGRRLGCLTANTQVQKTAVAPVHNAPSDEVVENSHTILHVFIEVRTCYILALPHVMLIPGFCAICSCLFFYVHLIACHGRPQRSPCSFLLFGLLAGIVCKAYPILTLLYQRYSKSVKCKLPVLNVQDGDWANTIPR